MARFDIITANSDYIYNVEGERISILDGVVYIIDKKETQ